jgi:hypothetical protein
MFTLRMQKNVDLSAGFERKRPAKFRSLRKIVNKTRRDRGRNIDIREIIGNIPCMKYIYRTSENEMVWTPCQDVT